MVDVTHRNTAKLRQPGFWRGRVKMAQDFNVLPEDIASAFRGERP